MLDSDYRQKLDQEAELWGREAEQQAQVLPPDWRYHRHLRHNVIMHAASIDNLLSCIKPGMKTLELGCASGWLTLAMAQRGAQAVGLDISPKALDVARRYYEKNPPRSGRQRRLRTGRSQYAGTPRRYV